MPKKFSSKRKSKSGIRSRTIKRRSRNFRSSSGGDYAPYGRQLTRYPAMFNPVPARLHNIVAPRFYTDLEYGFSGNISVAAAGTNFSVFANGLSTPGNTANPFTGAGGTLFPATHALNALNPVGFTNILTLYHAWRVWMAQVTVSCINSQAVAATPKLLVVIPTVSEAALADAQLAQSLPYSKSIVINGNGSTKENTIIMKMDTKTIYGLSQAQMQAEEDFTGAGAANPANSWLWNILIQDLGGNNLNVAGNPPYVQVRVNYHVEFFDPSGNNSDT